MSGAPIAPVHPAMIERSRSVSRQIQRPADRRLFQSVPLRISSAIAIFALIVDEI